MSEIQIEGGMLTASFEGFDVVRARRFTLKVPLAAIHAVSVGIPAIALKEPTTFWGGYGAGEMLVGLDEAHEGHRECFYEVRHPQRAITLEITSGRFEYVVLEPSNTTPESLVARIEAALGRHLPLAPRPPGLMDDAQAKPHDSGASRS